MCYTARGKGRREPLAKDGCTHRRIRVNGRKEPLVGKYYDPLGGADPTPYPQVILTWVGGVHIDRDSQPRNNDHWATGVKHVPIEFRCRRGAGPHGRV